MDSKQVLVLLLIICFSIEKTYATYKEQQQKALEVSKKMYNTLSITDDQYARVTQKKVIKAEDIKDLRVFERRVVQPVKPLGISDAELIGPIHNWVN